jgi:thiamine-monophosphate kinase
LKKNLRERGFVEFLRAQAGFRPPQLRLGIGDDAAIFRPAPGFESLLTCDLLVESVHFDLKTTPPWELGARAVAASLSDIAAMGGLPRAYLVSLAIPRRGALSKEFFKSLYAGMRAWGESFGAALSGGDSSSSPGPLLIDIFMLGEVEKGRALLRSGARPGDLVFCTGSPGDSAAGLAVLQGKLKNPDKGAAAIAVKRHLLPVPRCLAGRFLSTQSAASACIDISDGIASEAHHLSRESGVAIDLDADAIPLSPAVRALGKNALDWALRGGEDYELLFTAPPSKLGLLERDFRGRTGVSLSLIGRVKRGRGVRIKRHGKWKALADGGYEHKFF